jgi:saccharopine dehydrogenase-like NADP-dependent oxidoreductase
VGTLKVSVIGAGGVGQVIINHLAKKTTVRVGDMDRSRLKEVAKKVAAEISTSKLDASRTDAVAAFVRGSDIVINAAHPRLNLLIMRQTLKRGAHYIDLAGYPAKQVELDSRWKKARRVAILGMGEDPGLSNVMARRAVDMLDEVSEVKIRDGETSTSEAYPFVALFAPDVFLEEAVSPAKYFEGGEMKKIPPMSGREVYKFPQPIGPVPVYNMDHEEVHTLPVYLPKKPNFVDFKLALTDEAFFAIKLFQGLGLLNTKPMRVGKVKVSPLSFLLRVLPTPSEIAGKIRGNAGIAVETIGKLSGRRCLFKLYTMMSHEEAYEKYHTNATSYLTGTPTAVCASMLMDGLVENRGVIVPESLDAAKFIEESRKFDLQVQIETEKPGSWWS